jgi:hypothetical protein
VQTETGSAGAVSAGEAVIGSPLPSRSVEARPERARRARSPAGTAKPVGATDPQWWKRSAGRRSRPSTEPRKRPNRCAASRLLPARKRVLRRPTSPAFLRRAPRSVCESRRNGLCGRRTDSSQRVAASERSEDDRLAWFELCAGPFSSHFATRGAAASRR